MLTRGEGTVSVNAFETEADTVAQLSANVDAFTWRTEGVRVPDSLFARVQVIEVAEATDTDVQF